MQKIRLKRRTSKEPYLYYLHYRHLIALCILDYYPTIRTFYFHHQHGNLRTDYTHGGAQNFRTLLTSSAFLKRSKHALLALYGLLTIPFGFLLPRQQRPRRTSGKASFASRLSAQHHYGRQRRADFPVRAKGTAPAQPVPFQAASYENHHRWITTRFCPNRATPQDMEDLATRCFLNLRPSSIPTELHAASWPWPHLHPMFYITFPNEALLSSSITASSRFSRFTDLYILGGNAAQADPTGRCRRS
jgi:hypothetical protein